MRPLWRRRRNEELDEEIRSHLEMATQDRLEGGEPLKEARYAALRELGNVELIKEVTRDLWGWRWLQELAQDLRYSARTILREPLLPVIIIVILAVAIAANSTIFSVISAMLLRPLPVPHPEQIVVIQSSAPTKGLDGMGTSYPDLHDWQQQSTAFEGLAGMTDTSLNIPGNNGPEHVDGYDVSSNFFDVLGAKPMLGRGLLPSDATGRQIRFSMVISYALWQRLFGGDGSVIGKALSLNGAPNTIVGVMPPNFRTWVYPGQFWLAYNPDADIRGTKRGERDFSVLARLKQGETISRANAELKTITARLAHAYPETNEGITAAAIPWGKMRDADAAKPALLLLMGAVLFVLLIACVNVSGMLMARADGRRHELLVRSTLGAGRSRLFRQLLSESVVIALLAGAAGVLLSYWGALPMLRSALSFNAYVSGIDVRMDARVLGFTAGICVISVLLFGILPALQPTGRDLQNDLKQAGRTGTAGSHRRRLRRVLVVTQVALALVLVGGANTTISSVLLWLDSDFGYKPDHVLTARIGLAGRPYWQPEGWSRFVSQLLPRLNGVPGVEAAAVTTLPPDDNWSPTFEIQGRDFGAKLPVAKYWAVSPDYFRAMQIPVLKGRAFGEGDAANTAPVAIVNRAFAEEYFSGQALDHYIRAQCCRDQSWRRIVGVVGDIRNQPGQPQAQPEIYEPYLQQPSDSFSILVRTAADPGSFSGTLRNLVRSLDRDQAVQSIKTMDQVIADDSGGTWLFSLLLGTFAVIALLLASSGLYGLIAYSVGQRRRELGIRMALGAQRRTVLLQVMREAALMTALGLAIGACLAVPVNRALGSLLVGLNAAGAGTWLSAGELLALIALGAAFIPARRAAKVDPMAVLRYE